METRERLEVRHWIQGAIALYESAGKEETLARIANPEVSSFGASVTFLRWTLRGTSSPTRSQNSLWAKT